ncbi:phosphoglycerate dehydrogenase [Archaeoglobus neptunius]|uniref:phosphoglycerate dehydrogenase n=1 Tax=Archaeoglobus neptunius TaxID=2798580 RepID=UPI0019267E8E|nr:phosphoglycerate dehydrogenase [Archaeoglobus neptunius]
MKVLVAEPISDEAIEYMRENGLQVDVRVGMSRDELLEAIGDYEALIVRSQTKVDAEVIDAAKKLKIIGRAGVGVDNIDISTATQYGIVVVNAPGGNTISTAEHAIALILAAARKIPQADRSVKEGKWERKKFMGVELRGKTVGVIGLGRVGFEVAKRCKALEMNVVAFDPYVSKERAEQIGVKLMDLESLLSISDIITVHVPRTKETIGLLGKEQFDKMKDGVIVVNAARGGIVDEAALYEALKDGKVSAAALDVYEKEPPDPESPLLKMENIVTTPHIAASTREAQLNVGMIIAEDVVNMYRGLPVRNAVNLPSIEPAEFEYMMPFLTLAEKMGKIASVRLGGAIKKVKVTCSGKLAMKNTEFVTRALLKGIFEPILGNEINLVSAKPVAVERGITVEESKVESSEHYESLIEVSVESNGKEMYLAGTCFGKEYRILKIDVYNVNFIPKGHYVISLHEDRPGVIGRVGTLFGRNNINIAGMIVGRSGDEPGGIQLMLLLVDDPPTEEVLQEMIKLDGIIDATYVEL